MIEKCKKDKLFSFYMSGKKQQVFTGNFAGIDWKIKTDNLVEKDGEIIGLVDLKTCGDMHNKVNDISFIEMWGYDYQLALYQEILKQNIGNYVPCYIAAVSKEDGNETAVIYVDDERLQICRDGIENNIDKFKEIITGARKAQRCKMCKYCKSTRINDEVINYQDL